MTCNIKYIRLLALSFAFLGLFLTGWAQAQDHDSDAVLDAADSCPNTAAGASVDANGCPIPTTTTCTGDYQNAMLVSSDAPDGVVGNNAGEACADANTVPVASGFTGSATEGSTVTLAAADLGTDADGDTLSFSGFVGCTVTPTSGAGPFTFTYPTAGSTDTCSYTVSDGRGGTATGAISLTGTVNDHDGDGVADAADSCPNTAAGASVDANGCPIPTSTTCTGDYQNAMLVSSEAPDGAVANNTSEACATANTPPVASGFTGSGTEGTSVTLTAAQLGTDADGDTLSFSDFVGCTVTPTSGTGPFTFTYPAAGVTDTCSYTVDDGNGGTDTGAISLTGTTNDHDGDGVTDAADSCPNTAAGASVDANGCPIPTSTTCTGDYQNAMLVSSEAPDGAVANNTSEACAAANTAPVASGFTGTATEGTTVTLTAAQLGSDPDGDTLSFSGFVGCTVTPTSGTGPFTFTYPAAGVTDTCSYTVDDGNGGTATGAISLTGTTNDHDGDGVVDSADSCPNTAAGASVDANGCPIPTSTTCADDYQNTILISSENPDSDVSSNTAEACAAANNPPVASGFTGTATEGTTVTLTAAQLGTDPDGDTLSFNGFVGCTVTPTSGAGPFTFTYPANGVTDTCSYTVNDGRGGTATGTINLTGTLADHDGDGVTDPDDSCPNTAAGASVDANGCPIPTTTTCTDDYQNTILISSENPDSDVSSNTAEACATSNSPPVASGFTGTATEGTTVTLTAAQLGTDPDGDTLSFSGFVGCTVSPISGAGPFTFTYPAAGVTDTCSYTVDDGNGGTDTGTISLTGTTNDHDGDGVVDSADSCPNTAAGASVDANGCPIPTTTTCTGDYQNAMLVSSEAPDGDVTNNIGEACAAANNPPVASNFTGTATEGTTVTLTAAQLGSDPDGDTLSFSGFVGCTVTPTSGTGPFTFTYPAAGVTDTCSFTVDDGNGGTDTGTISLTGTTNDHDGDGVTDPNDSCPNTAAGASVDANGCPIPTSTTCTGDYQNAMLVSSEAPDGDVTNNVGEACAAANNPPVASSFIGTATEGTTVTLAAAMLGSDPDGDTLSFSGFVGCTVTPTSGAGPFTFTYPAAGVTDACTYTVDDGNGGTAAGIVNLTGVTNDHDGDGVTDPNDSCPHTAPGASVDANGCPIPTGTTCSGDLQNAMLVSSEAPDGDVTNNIGEDCASGFTLNMAKTASVLTDLGNDQYRITYVITVDNGEPSDSVTYDLTDTPDMVAGAVITSFVMTTPGGTTSIVTPTAGVYTLASGAVVDPLTVDTYTLVVDIDASGLATPEATLAACNPDAPVAGTGTYNAAELNAGPLTTLTSEACADGGGTSAVVVSKQASVVSNLGGGNYAIVYRVRVSNTGNTTASYDLADTFAFDADISVSSASMLTVPAGSSATANTLGFSVTGATIGFLAQHIYEVRVVFTYTGSGTAADVIGTCDSADPQPNTGLYNSVDVIVDGGIPVTAEACEAGADTTGALVLQKQSAITNYVDGDTVSVLYTVTMTNSSSVAQVYDLEDSFGFHPDFTVVAGSVSLTETSAAVTPNASFDGATDPVIVTAQSIAAGATHRFEIAVDVDYTGTGNMVSTIAGCTDGETAAPGQGLFNTASASIDGLVFNTESACPANLATDLSLTKTRGTTAAYVGDVVSFTLTLTNDSSVTAVLAEVTDVLPINLEYVAHDTASGTATHTPVVAAYTTGSLVWQVPEVPAGGSVTLTLYARLLP